MPAFVNVSGAPCWVDLNSVDLEGVKPFYAALFGWTFQDMGEEFGHYHIISRGDDVVGGAMQYIAEFMGPKPINGWFLDFATADVGASCARAVQFGASVIVQPMAVADQGSNAELRDPNKESFGFWQGANRKGFDRFGEHGFPGWFELHTRGYDAALAFYPELLGAEPLAAPLADNQRYVSLMVNGKATAGMWDIQDVLPDDSPTGWNICLVVDDEAAALDAISAHGGTVVTEPEPIQYGRMATVQDPAGATFCIISSYTGL